MNSLNLSGQTLTESQIERLHQLMDRGDAFVSTDVEKCLEVLVQSQEVRRFEGELSGQPTIARGQFLKPRYIGCGAFGIVFFVFDQALGMDVAIKLLRPSRNSSITQQRFLEEAKITASLSHPGIIRLFDSGTIGGIPYISSTLADGGSLADLLVQHPQGMDASLACELMIQVAESVSFAHSKATFHRDLKPGNILLEKSTESSGNYRTIVSDFGLAKRWNQGSSNAALTLDGDLLGTARYMSPEQAAGDLAAFAITSEVFTLGIILYEMLTGLQPFDGETNAEIRRQILAEQPRSPRSVRSDVPKDLNAIVMQCLQKAPSDRYESVASLARDLRRFRDYEPVEAAKPSWIRRAVWQASKHPVVSTVVAASLLVVTVSLMGIGTAWWWQSQAWQQQLQTKMDYVTLLGGLIDDVVSGEKDVNMVMLESLNEFEANLAKDLQITPKDLKLRHLQSVLSNYQSVVLSRQNKFVESFRSRVDSVAVLKQLRAEYPHNSKIRYQYIYGAIFLVDSLNSFGTSDELPYCESKLGWPDCNSIVNDMLQEIPQFMQEFPDEVDFILGCYDFRQRMIGKGVYTDPKLAEELTYMNVNSSKKLADEHPDKPLYIKPALTALLSWTRTCLADHQNADALRHAQTANEIFENYLKPIELPWTMVLLCECKGIYAEALLVNGMNEQAYQCCVQTRTRLAGSTAQLASHEFRLAVIEYATAKRLNRDEELEELRTVIIEKTKLIPPGIAAQGLAQWSRLQGFDDEAIAALERAP